MSYIGTKPTVGNFQICDAISVVNGQAAYTMQVGGVNVNPQSANHMIVSLNGTIQKPNSSFTVANSVITFSSNLVTGDVIDFIQILGDVLDLGVPSDGTVTTAKLASDSVTYEKIGYNANQYRNIIINGDMSIAQRATSASSITSSGYHTVDRWRPTISSAGTWTISQSTDVPTGQGFGYSQKFDCTTADASLSAGDYVVLQQRIEGQNLQYLKKGTSSAESTTLSFWVYATKTGTNIVELYDNDNTRQISKSYTISSSNTWEKKTVTFAGDTSGAFGNDNARSLDVRWWLGAGSNYTSGTLSTTWTSSTNANRAVGQVNHADNTSNNFYITGVQLEAGTTASDFEFLPVDVQTQRCLRYYETSMTYGDYSQYHGQKVVFGNAGTSFGASSTSADGRQFKVWKRANPTVTLYHQDGTSGAVYTIYNAAKITGVAAQHLNQSGFLFIAKTSAFATGYGYYYGYTADAEL